MGTTRMLCGLLTLVALLLPAAGVAATDPFVGSSPRITRLPVPSAAYVVGDDDDHHVLFSVRTDEAQLLYANFDLDLDNMTVAAVPLPGEDCSLINASAGWLVAHCGPWRSDGWLRAPESSDWTPVALHQGESLLAAGRYWLETQYDDPHDRFAMYLSRSDGRMNLGGGVVDLNSPGLQVPICKPISPTGLTVYDKPWALRTTGRAVGRLTLTAQRCGSKRRRVLARGVYGYTLHGNVATWTTLRRAYVHNLRSGKTITVRIPHGDVSLSQIGDHVIAQSSPVSGGNELYLGTVRLPRSFGR